jgi:hypothetical protein
MSEWHVANLIIAHTKAERALKEFEGSDHVADLSEAAFEAEHGKLIGQTEDALDAI